MHGHCTAVGCYNRIQFVETCSRCGGPVTFAAGCCDLNPTTPVVGSKRNFGWGSSLLEDEDEDFDPTDEEQGPLEQGWAESRQYDLDHKEED
jgi:hypothetical protein